MPPTHKKSGIGVKLPSVSIGGVGFAKLFSISMLIVAIIFIGVLFYQVMASFFVPLFLAALLVVIFRPIYEWILRQVRGHRRTASALSTLLILLMVLLPAGSIISIAAAQGVAFVRGLQTGGVKTSLERARSSLSLDLPASQTFRQLNELLESLNGEVDPERVATGAKQSIEWVEVIKQEAVPTAAVEATTEQFRNDLEALAKVADELRQAGSSTEVIEQERLQQKLANQLSVVSSSKHLWDNAVLGNALMARLKSLANPSDAEIQSLIDSLQSYLSPRVFSFTQAAGHYLLQMLIGFVILTISLYFFFADGSRMILTLMRLSPLDDEYEARLLLEFDRISRAVVLASVLSALAQGVLSAIGFWMAGLPMVTVLFLITSFMSLVPFLGAASVWAPCALYLAAIEHRIGAAIAIAIYGATVISSIDNVIKMYVLQGHSQLHPLLALLSVLGGIQVFGPIGILVGPMVVVFLQTLLEILNHELEGRPKDSLESQIATD